MLVLYFLRNFFYQGALAFAIFTGIFASCNIFLRLSLINSIFSIPLVLATMLPLMALFSLPLSASLAVFMTVAQHKTHDELLTLSFLKPARFALHKAVIIFTISCTTLYMLFVFQLAPQSYRLGKKLLINVAREHFLQLEPNKFHTPFSSFTFFFKEKNFSHVHKKEPIFKTLFLVFKTNKEQYFFTAQEGFFTGNTLILTSGSIHTLQNHRFHKATFEKTALDLDQFIHQAKTDKQFSSVKFATLKNLLASNKTDHEAFIELHKRYAQTLWQLAMPIFALFAATIFTATTLLASIMSCGTLYLLSYVLIALAQSQPPVIALIIFYMPLFLLLLLGLIFYKN